MEPLLSVTVTLLLGGKADRRLIEARISEMCAQLEADGFDVNLEIKQEEI